MCFPIIVELTFFVCTWRWSCNSLHESSWWYKCCCWHLRRREGLAWFGARKLLGYCYFIGFWKICNNLIYYY